MRLKSIILIFLIYNLLYFETGIVVFAQEKSTFENTPFRSMDDISERAQRRKDREGFSRVEDILEDKGAFGLEGSSLPSLTDGDEDYSFIPSDKDELFSDKFRFSEKLKELEKPDLKGEVELNLDIELVSVDLPKVLETTLRNNFDIQILQAKKDKAKWEYYEKFSDYFPDIGYEFDIARYSGEFLAGNIITILVNETPIKSKFYLDWDVFEGLERFYELRSERHLYKASKLNEEFSTDEALRDAATKYYALLGYKLAIEIFTVNLEQRKAQLKINHDRYHAGLGNKFDVLRAESNVAQAEQDLISSYNSFRLAQADLANTAGINVFTPLFPIERDVDKKVLIDEALDLESLSNLAIHNRPDLKAQRHNVEAQIAEKKSNYSEYIPHLNIYGQLSNEGTRKISPRRGQVIGLNVNVPFGSNLGFKGVAEINAAAAELKEKKLTLIKETRKVKEDVLKSYYDSLATKETIKAAAIEVEAARESLRLSVLRLETGIGIFVDVLQAQAQATEAKVELVRAIIEYNIAQVELLFSSGMISVSNLLGDYSTNKEAKDIKNDDEIDEEKR